MAPSEGNMPPDRIFSKVDLPEPFGPVIAKREPEGISKLRSLKMDF
jgi:hypothetical protein